MPGFVTLQVDIGLSERVSLTMPSATTISNAAMRFADYLVEHHPECLSVDVERFYFFLLDPSTQLRCPSDDLVADHDGEHFFLEYEPRAN